MPLPPQWWCLCSSPSSSSTCCARWCPAGAATRPPVSSWLRVWSRSSFSPMPRLPPAGQGRLGQLLPISQAAPITQPAFRTTHPLNSLRLERGSHAGEGQPGAEAGRHSPTASSSSMNTTQGAFLRASANSSLQSRQRGGGSGVETGRGWLQSELGCRQAGVRCSLPG
jgi:hypothetical protein